VPKRSRSESASAGVTGPEPWLGKGICSSPELFKSCSDQPRTVSTCRVLQLLTRLYSSSNCRESRTMVLRPRKRVNISVSRMDCIVRRFQFGSYAHVSSRGRFW
jgi:hypothetical protein